MSLTTVRVIWGAIFFSTFVELGVVLWGDFDRHVDLRLEASLALAGAATALVVASIVLPGRLYAATLTRLSLPVIESPAQDTARDYRTATGGQRTFRDAAGARSAALRAFKAPLIVGLALVEAIAILGVVIAQGRFAPSSYGLPFFAVAWVLFGLRFPRVHHVLGPAERVYSARFPDAA